MASGTPVLVPGRSRGDDAEPSIDAGLTCVDEDEELVVDDENVAGYQHVDRLAAYLVDLRGQTDNFLTNVQASTIISLWNRLDNRDKERVVYAARHQERLLSGKFRTPKKPTHTPGVESTTRCFLGASSAPAQWPDCCRLVKAIFIRLCNIHTSPKKKGRGATSRWSMIIYDYRKIRQLVLGNSTAMTHTSLQLAEVNQYTLVQWYNERQKKQELDVLLQGTVLPPPLPEAKDPLQEARTLHAEAVTPRDAHQYKLPESTAGQARQRSDIVGPRPIKPKGSVKRQLLSSPPAPAPFLQLPPQILVPPPPVFQVVPISFLQQGTQMVQPVPVLHPGAVDQGTTPQSAAPPGHPGPAERPQKRLYRRTVQANTCKKCGQFRTSATGHSQYRGRVYCPLTETMTKDSWFEEMRKKFSK